MKPGSDTFLRKASLMARSILGALGIAAAHAAFAWAGPGDPASWLKQVTIREFSDGECPRVDLAFRSPGGGVKHYRGLFGEVVVLEKQRRLIVISTCPMIRPEFMYFFSANGALLKKIEMTYGGIRDYRFDEKKNRFIVRYSQYVLKDKRMVETADHFDPDGNLRNRAPVKAAGHP